MTRWQEGGRDARRLRVSVDDLVAQAREGGEERQAAYDLEHHAALAEAAARTRAEAWERMCPPRFRATSLEWTAAEHGPEVVAELLAWAHLEPRPNLVLLGPVGTGKTGTALTVVRDDWLTSAQEVRFCPVVDLLQGLRPGGDVDLDRLMRVPRLVLDDLGAERPTDWTTEQLYALVNRRWLEERPTVVTSNLEPEPLAEAVGQRLFSRLVGDGAVVVRLSGRDRRRR